MYSGIADPQRWILPQALIEHAEQQSEAPWITLTTGERMTFGEAAADVRRVAGYFASLGIKAGDRVIVLLPNSCDYIRVWLGLGLLGAVAVLLNTQLRGGFLRHQLASASARLLVVDGSLLGVAAEVLAECPAIRQIVLIQPEVAVTLSGIEVLDWNDWKHSGPYSGPLPSAQDIACIMYTSGTSGPAKGVLMPHAHCALFGAGIIDALQIQPDDRYYISLPLFHANGLLMQLGATLLAGIPAVIRPKFSASEWLNDICTYDATITNMLGALAAFVLGQPPTPDDRNHRLRAMLNAPNLLEHEAAFRERFGVRDVISGFGMTEVNNPILGRVGRPCPGASGWVRREHFEVIIANPETDKPVEAGQIGEILVRPKMPFGFMAGYHDMPEKTVEAWRNLWFHTGDAGMMNHDGLVTFIDRIKDCIRRRGENIAATEVEVAVGTLAGVQEVAAYAVPSEIPGGEDEVMLAIVPVPGTQPSLELLGEQAEAVLPRFARPRFLELMTELPKTGTGKVQRAALRKRGSGSAYDRDSNQVAGAIKR